MKKPIPTRKVSCQAYSILLETLKMCLIMDLNTSRTYNSRMQWRKTKTNRHNHLQYNQKIPWAFNLVNLPRIHCKRQESPIQALIGKSKSIKNLTHLLLSYNLIAYRTKLRLVNIKRIQLTKMSIFLIQGPVRMLRIIN